MDIHTIYIITYSILILKAYVFELDDEYADTDIPTTLIRSKADCPSLEVVN